MTRLELPIIPKPGEVWLSIELNRVENMTVSETLKTLEGMGYIPELRYRQSKADGTISIYALLKQEYHQPEKFVDSDYLGAELDALAEIISPTAAISSPRGLPRRQPIPAL